MHLVHALNDETLPQNDDPSNTKAYTAENRQEHPAQKDTISAQPSFTLKATTRNWKKRTSRTGRTKPITLEGAGMTEGHGIYFFAIKIQYTIQTSCS